MQKTIYPVYTHENPLPFYLTGIGISDPEYCVKRENGLVSHQLLMTLEGEGRLEIDGKSFILNKGSCLYLPPNVPHEYYPVENSWKTAWIVFRGSCISQVMKSMGFDGYILKEEQNTAKFMQSFDRIYAAAQDSLGGQEKCSALIYELILSFRQDMRTSFSSESSCSEIAEKTVRYIDENYSSDITLSELADNAGVSEQHLCRVFKSVMNMRPMEYLARRRIAVSKSLLLDNKKSITEISSEVGYSGLTYFGMVFRKYEGISPKEFRRSGGYINL